MGETRNWLRLSWSTGLALALIVALAFFLRTYFSLGLWYPSGYFSNLGDYSGGSDPFYWERAMFYSLHTGKEIAKDAAMNYPIGFPDVRPPLFTWFNLLVGYIISPLFGSVVDASVFMLIMNAAIMGTLTLIPTYLLGKEAFGKRTGLVAALLLAISAAALQRSHATIAVHDAWTLFFVVCAFYFYLRALKTLDRKRWVENWFSRASVTAGLRLFFRENRKPVLYSLLAGMSVAVTALSWQGWAYVPVILVLIFVVELLFDRIRNQDVMGVTILFALIIGTPLLVSFPWYYVRSLIKVWWDVPFYLFAVMLILGIVFSVTRDYPWTIVIPAAFIAGGTALVVGFVVNPALLLAFYSGAGYFVKTKVYQTIAEAQEPGLSELFLSYGWFTYFIGLAAIGWMVWQMPRRNNAAFTMLVFWTLGSLFMAVSAARFIFNAAPPFAIATGWAIDLVLIRMDFAGMRRTYRSLAEGSRRNAFRKSVKARHVLTILFLVFLVLLPNTWFAVDAAIPFENKASFDAQINSLLPSFLRAPGYNPSSGTFYLGAFGYSLPKSTDYFPAAYNWLATQDTRTALENRPALLSWWDYGFEVTERGGHPVVADPFQNGYAIAGQFILAQNESTAIALMSLRLIEGDYYRNGIGIGPEVSALLEANGLSPATFDYALRNQAALVPTILNNPKVYGLWDSNLQPYNAMYIYLRQAILARLTEDQIVNLYHSLRSITGNDISYFMVDTRLFPISATNTGIFYAPVKLSDHRVVTLQSGQVLPIDFFQIFANTQNAQGIPLQYVQPQDTIQSETIAYQPMFYNSMFYRAYVGYTPTDLGISNDTGIPGFDSKLQAYQPVPAWNMTHFRLVYRTSYYNPYKDSANHTSAWRAVGYDEGLALQKQIQAGTATGVVDLSTQATVQNGLVVLRYYDGAYVNGTVTVGGSPVPHAWVTLKDELGTPHGVTTTDANGRYSLLAPFGNITLTVSTGTLTRTTLTGTTVLATTTFPVTADQANRVNEDLDGNGIPDWLITRDLTVPAFQVRGSVYFDLNHDGALNAGDVPLSGATVRLANADLKSTVILTTNTRGEYATPSLTQGQYTVSVETRGHTVGLSPLSVASGLSSTKDLLVPFGTISGTVVGPGGQSAAGATVEITDATNGTTWSILTDSGGRYNLTPVLSGGYNLTAQSGVLGTLPALVSSTGSKAQYANLTLGPMGRVAGSTSVMGVLQPFATLQFQSETDPSKIVTVTSDAAGTFDVGLPEGRWNVNGRAYGNGQLYAYLARVDVATGLTRSLSPSFVAGVRVNGTITGQDIASSVRPSLTFFGNNAEWWVRGGAGGAYLAYLPQGVYPYQASAQETLTKRSWAYFGEVDLTSSRTLNVPLWSVVPATETVYWDANGNGLPDAGEAISGARLSLHDDLGRPLLVVSNATGEVTLFAFANRTYSGSLSAVGFDTVTVDPGTPDEIMGRTRFDMDPVPVAVVGRVLLNGSALLNRPVTVRAVPLGTSARAQNVSSQTDGSYSLSLVPGAYSLVVDENVSATNASRYQNRGTDSVALTVAEGLVTQDLALVYRALVVGNVTLGGSAVVAGLNITGPDNRSFMASRSGFRMYLQPGPYVVSATRTSGGFAYAALLNESLPGTGNLTLVLAPAIQLHGQLTYAGQPLAEAAVIFLVRSEGGSYLTASTSAGTYAVYVAPGNYTLSVNTTATVPQGTYVRFYRYTGSASVSVAGGTGTTTFDLALARTLDNTTVSGSVTFAGAGVDGTISFLALDPGAINATASVASGSYSVGLAPGSYTAYAVGAASRGAFLGSLTVHNAATLSLNAELTPAFDLSGVTTDASGTRTSAKLSVHGTATLVLSTDTQGAYRLLLPEGSYNVTANRAGSEQGVPVLYSGSQDLELTSDAVANIQLAKVMHRGVAIIWDSSQNRTIAAGGSVTYTIVVRNTGNVADSYALSGLTTGWTFAFSPSIVSLNYGSVNNATAVSVTIKAPADATVAHSPVNVAATSLGDTTVSITQVLTVGILRTRSLGLTVDAGTATFDGRYLNYTVRVRNTGNAAETVDALVTNPSDLATSGWIAGLSNATQSAPGGTILRRLSVPANGSVSVRLTLRSAGGASGATVVLQAVAEDDPTVSAGASTTAQLPALSVTTGIGVAGPSDSKSLPPNIEFYTAIAAAVAGAGAALFLTRRRR